MANGVSLKVGALVLLLAVSEGNPQIAPVEGIAPAQDREELKRARGALRRGDYETAERMYERLAANRPDAWEPRAGYVRACLEQGKRDRAARVAEAYLTSHADHAGARLALAQAALDRGEPARALELLAGLPSDVRARALSAQSLVALDRIDEAVRTAQPLADAYAQNHDNYMKEELFAVAQGLALYARYSSSAEPYKQVVQLLLPDILKADPADATVRAFLGHCLLDKRDLQSAAQAFEEALQANPNGVPAMLGQARLLLDSGRHAPALALCERALAVNATSEDAHALRSEILLRQRDPRAAIASIDRGLASNPRSARLRSLRAAARHLSGDPDFEQEIRRAHETHPKSPLPYWEIARALVAGGGRRFDEAQAFFRKALERNGLIPELVIDAAINGLRLGDEGASRKSLEEAGRRDPFDNRLSAVTRLLRDWDTDFEVLAADHFRVRIARSERRWLESPVRETLARAWKEMTARYGFAPSEPVFVEVYPKVADLAVRLAGAPEFGPPGACFGRGIATLSPRARAAPDANVPPYGWAPVLWRHLALVFSHQLSKGRVPGWLAEGLAEHEQGLGFPRFRREADVAVLLARRRGELAGIAGLEAGRSAPQPALTVGRQGSLVCAFVAEKHGGEAIARLLRAYADGRKTEDAFLSALGSSVEALDKEYFRWIDARTAKLRYRLPSKDPVSQLLVDATADPKDAGAAARLAFALLASGKEKEAENWGRRAVEAEPSSPDAHSAYGEALLRTRNLDESIPHLQKGSDDYQNWEALGRAASELERWREAADAFRRAIECLPVPHEDPPGDNVHRRLNAALLAVKDYEGAMKALEQLVALDPLDFPDRLKLAKLYEERQDYARMGAVLDEASAVEVRDLSLLDGQAAVHRARKEYAKATEKTIAALALLEEEAKEEDANAKADRYCAIGEDWLAQGRKEKALEYAQEALRLVSGLERARKLYDACRSK